MAESKNKLEDDGNYIYYQELVTNSVGEKDWEKNTGFYVKMYKEYSKYPGGTNSIIEEVSSFKATKLSRGMDIDRPNINNEGAYLNKCLQNGLDNLIAIHGERPDNVDYEKIKTTEIIDVNIAEINPGWATDKYISEERIVVYTDEDGNKRRLICRNKTTHKTPNNTAMRLWFEIERLYFESGCLDDRAVTFFNRDILKRLGWGVDGRAYERLKTCLDILRYSEILTDQIYKYKDKGEVKYIPGKITINMLDSLETYDDQGHIVTDKQVKTRVVLNEYFAKNIKGKYFFIMNSSIYKQLESPIEFYLGLLITKRRGKNNEQKFITFKIAQLCEQIGMVTKTPAERKRNLEHAFTTLKDKSIIAGWKFNKDQVLIAL
jgi:hypothetical protein